MDIEAIRFIDKLNTLAKRTAKQLYVPWTKAKQRNHLTTINASLCYDDRAGKAEGLSALLDDDW